jgi:hypothetical protein
VITALTDCAHDYELAGVDPHGTAGTVRKATFRCVKCFAERSIVTAKTDAQIAQALTEAKANA